MTFQSLLRRNEIGANSYLVELGGKRIILDSGMHPKEEGLDSLPAHHELEKNSIDSIFVSHSHLDHSGSLPVIMRAQPDADVYMTPATTKLVDAGRSLSEVSGIGVGIAGVVQLCCEAQMDRRQSHPRTRDRETAAT